MNKIKQINDYYITKNDLDLHRIIEDFTPYVSTIINNMAYGNLSNEDKEEIQLDVFFVLWKNKSNILGSLDSYIAGITKNLVKEKLRKKRITYDISDYENKLVYSNFDLYSDEREEIIRIEKSINKLKKTDLEIVKMFYYSAESIKDIAKKLKISEFNVTSRLYRIRKKIKKELNIGGKNAK